MIYPTLFSPTTIGGVPVRNRVAHASIVSRFVHQGRATDQLVNYLASRARGGAGLVVTEPVAMTFANRSPQRLRGWDDAALDDLKRVAAAVERWDSRLLGQVQRFRDDLHRILDSTGIRKQGCITLEVPSKEPLDYFPWLRRMKRGRSMTYKLLSATGFYECDAQRGDIEDQLASLEIVREMVNADHPDVPPLSRP